MLNTFLLGSTGCRCFVFTGVLRFRCLFFMEGSADLFFFLYSVLSMIVCCHFVNRLAVNSHGRQSSDVPWSCLCYYLAVSSLHYISSLRRCIAHRHQMLRCSFTHQQNTSKLFLKRGQKAEDVVCNGQSGVLLQTVMQLFL